MRLRFYLSVIPLVLSTLFFIDSLFYYFYKKSLYELAYERARLQYRIYLDLKVIEDPNAKVLKIPQRGYLSFYFSKDGEPLIIGIKKEFIERKLLKTFKRLILLELITLPLFFLFSELLYRSFFSSINEYRRIIDLLLMSITHKVGNFLAVQKLNLSLLQRSKNGRALRRMRKSLEFLERDVRTLNQFFKEREIRRETLDLSSLIKETLHFLSEELEGKRINLRLTKVFWNLPRVDGEDIIYNLLFNALRYSKERISIRSCKRGNKAYLVVSNDYEQSQSQGYGLGIRIINELCKRHNIKVRYKVGKRFTVMLEWKA